MYFGGKIWRAKNRSYNHRVREAMMPLHKNGSGPDNRFNIPDDVLEFLARAASHEGWKVVAKLPNLTVPQRSVVEEELRHLVARKLLR